MKTKEEILAELQEGLNSGILTELDIKPFISTPQPGIIMTRVAEPENKPAKATAANVMFYIAGMILFAAVMSIIVQSWDDSNPFMHIMLSAFIGVVMWSIAYSLIKSPSQNDIREGLTNALLLTGSLLIVVGGYIITNTIIGGYDEINYIPAAFALVVLGGLHVGFDKLIKRDLILLMGVFLAVSSFPALLFGFLDNSGMSMDAYVIVLIISSGILVCATRIVAKVNPDRKKIHNSFDSFAAFLALMSMYVASNGDFGVLWYGILIAAIFGIFYLSIILQNKHLLGNGSFFMVLTIITISFKYFSGLGLTFSLIVAALALLGSAVIASSLNKKYFNKTVPEPTPQATN